MSSDGENTDKVWNLQIQTAPSRGDEKVMDDEKKDKAVHKLRPADATQVQTNQAHDGSKQSGKLRLASGVADVSEHAGDGDPNKAKDCKLRLAPGGPIPEDQEPRPQVDRAKQMNTLEASFRAYWAILDGIARDVGTLEEQTLDEFIHEDYRMDFRGQTLGKMEWKEVVSNMIRDGAQSNILFLEENIRPGKPFEYKLQFVFSDISDRSYHSIGVMEGGKLIRSEAFDKRRYQTLKTEYTKARFMDYSTMINGVARPFGESEEKIFETIVHRDFIAVNGERRMNKDEWKRNVADMVMKGEKAEISDVKCIGDDHVEYKIQVKGNNQVYLMQHNIASFEEGILVRVEPFEKIAYLEILRDICEMNYVKILALLNLRGKFDQEGHEAYEAAYHDNFHMIYNGKPLTKSGYKAVLTGLVSKGAQFEILHLEWIDETHMVYKARIYFKDGWDQMPHAIATIQDGKIIQVQPYEESRYVELSRAAFERNFSDMFSSLSFNQRAFDRTYHEKYSIVFNGITCDKDAWRKTIFGMSKQFSKTEVERWAWIDDNHIEYKLIHTFRDGSIRMPHAIGTVKDWKLIHSEPFREISSMSPKADHGSPVMDESLESTFPENETGTEQAIEDSPGAFRVGGLHTPSSTQEDDCDLENPSTMQDAALVQAEVAPNMDDMLEAAREEGRREVTEAQQEKNVIVVATPSKKNQMVLYVISLVVVIAVVVTVGVTVGISSGK